MGRLPGFSDRRGLLGRGSSVFQSSERERLEKLDYLVLRLYTSANDKR